MAATWSSETTTPLPSRWGELRARCLRGRGATGRRATGAAGALAEALLGAGDRERRVALHRDGRAVSELEVRLVRRALVVGLDTDHGRARVLGERGRRHLLRGRAREERL